MPGIHFFPSRRNPHAWPFLSRWGSFALFALLIVSTARPSQAAEEESILYPWTVGISAGALQFEGDEPFNDSYVVSGHLSYDHSDRISLEGILQVAPALHENFRFDIPTGQRVSRLQEEAGVSSTESVGLALDILFSSGLRRFDPYFSLGAGTTWYADDVENDNDLSFRLGTGLFANINDTWALRFDVRTIVAGSDTEANLIAGGGLFRTLGVKQSTPPTPLAPTDTDGDGLSDADESNKHKTDPMNPDTDWDGLSDGAEVMEHKTHPLKRDTDGGGVADGHELLQDGTNPLQKKDDSRLFELKPVYAADGSTLKEEYLTELDVVGQYLAKRKDSKVLIEAHVDDEKGLGRRASKRLTQKRANGIADTLIKKWDLKPSLVEAVGQGTSQPKSKPGSGKNERVEIYVK